MSPPITEVDDPRTRFAIILTKPRTVRQMRDTYIMPVGTVIRFEMLSANKIAQQANLKPDEAAVPAAEWKLGDVVTQS